MNPWNQFQSQVLECVEGPLEKPKSFEHGDLAYPCFSLAKAEKKSPLEIAKSKAESIDCSKFDLIKEVKAIGPYVNFVLNYDKFTKLLFDDIIKQGDKFGKTNQHSGRAIVEFPSVNPNKPWHIGHARNAVLGDTMARLLENVGYEVLRTDYIDNLGLQVAKTLWGVKRFGIGKGKYDLELGKVYTKAEAAMENPETESEVRSFLKRMEEGNNEISNEARKLCSDCVKSQYETGYKLGIFHDLMVWESDIVESGIFEEAIEEMKHHPSISIAKDGKKKGCLVADFSKMEEFANLEDPDKVLLRSDGTATYVAKDIAFQMWKCGLAGSPFVFEEFAKQPNGKPVMTTSQTGERKDWGESKIVVNVIGMPQAHPQRMVYSTLKIMGYDFAFEKSYHLAYANVAFEENGKILQFSGRRGNWFDYTVDALIEKAEKKAYAEVNTKNPDLDDDLKKEISESVGRGAIRYTLLKTAPEKEIIFRWEDALSFEGDAAPYLQYAHARACRLLERGTPQNVDFKLNDAEKKLVRKLAEFSALVSEIPVSMKHEIWGTSVAINSLCEYCCGLAAEFNSFYNKCRVLGSPEENQRLALVKAFQQVMKNGLTLLGIDAVERM